MSEKDLTTWTKKLRKSIQALTAIAAFIFSIISGFLVPVGFTSDERSALVRFAAFILAILIGVAFIMRRKWVKISSKSWAIITILLLTAAIISWILYWNFLSQRTCIFADQRIIVGTEYTDHAAAYVSRNPNMACDEIIGNYAGKVQMIWKEGSINRMRLLFQILYLSCTILSALCLLSLAQAMEDSDTVRRGASRSKIAK